MQVAEALYSVPGELVGRRLDARVDASTVKLYWHGELIKVHPVVGPGRRQPIPPIYGRGVGLCDAGSEHLAAQGIRPGDHVGAYAAAVLEQPLPWTKMRQVYRLLGWCAATAVDDACRRAVDTKIIDVGLIDRMCSHGKGEQLPEPGDDRPVFVMPLAGVVRNDLEDFPAN